MNNLDNRVERNKRKTNFSFIFKIIIAVVLLSGAGFSFYKTVLNRDSNEVNKIAENFIQIIENKNYENFSEVLEPQSYTSLDYSLDDVINKYQQIFAGIQITKIKASNVNVEKVDGREYDFSYHLSFTTPLGQLKDLNYHTKIKKTNGHFLLAWDPSLILPGMEGKDKVAYRELKAKRGEIKDRLDNGLAINKDFKSVGIVPKDLKQGDKKKKRIQTISQKFDISTDEINEKLNQSWVKDDLFVPLKTIDSNESEQVPGVTYQNTKRRYYPLKEAAAHLIGYAGKVTREDLEKHPSMTEGDIIGKSGLERALDKKLRGRHGGEIVIVDEHGNDKQIVQETKKVDGEDVHLTIDAYVQAEAFESLDENSGSTVVMNPKDGGLYALVSTPSYDPNLMAQGISQKEYDKYADNPDKPFISRFAVRYAPGSTFKALTASIGLDSKVTYPDKVRKINGLSWKKDKSWGDYSVTRVSDVKKVDMKKALIYSDNIYFAQEALEMGEKTFRKGLNQFIFGEELDLPLSMEPAQISNKSTFDSDILLADTAYGQGQLLISPIQQLTMYSVFQNDGDMVYPRLIDDDSKPKTKSAITSSTANEMKQRLGEVVNDPNGTAHLLSNPNYDLAAKTGTAELKTRQGEKGVENSFLLAFEKEQDSFSLLSLVEDYSPGNSATQLNKTLIDHLYDYLHKR